MILVRRVKTPRGRWVLLHHRRRIVKGRAVDDVRLDFGGVTDELPTGFRFPPGADRQMDVVHGQRVVDLDTLRSWIEYQPDDKARAALATFVAWAEAIATDTEEALA